MPLTMQNILSHEWIGLQVTVAENADPRTRGLTGRVVDETRNMLAIETDRGILRIAKNHSIFRANLPTGETLIDGNELRYRPEDRIKKGLNKW